MPSRLADAMLTADVLDVPAALHFLQYPDDLTFTEPALAHLGLLGNIVCPRPPVMRGPILGDGYTLTRYRNGYRQ